MIRLAEQRDYEAVVSLAMEFARQAPYEAEVDENKIRELISAFYDFTKNIIILLTHDDIPVGMIIGVTSEFLLNRQRMATEIAWYVQPKHRGRESLRLRKAFEYWAEHSVHASRIHLSSLNTPAVHRHLTRDGYVLTECAYIKEIK